jgi:hypothetical protein
MVRDYRKLEFRESKLGFMCYDRIRGRQTLCWGDVGGL